MDRRLLTVLGMSVVLALVVAAIFYQVSSHASAKATTPNMKDVVVAVEVLPLGVAIKPNHVKVVKIPVDMYPKAAFGKVDDVLDRSVISAIMADEPLLEGRLAPRGSGMGLAPIIPTGMRAMAVRVNEIIGVAGFVLPGMRVDVLMAGNTPGQDQASTGTQCRTILQNIEVLSAGQKIEKTADGKPESAQVVNLLVSPDQAEILNLASSETKVQLVLRNPLDTKSEVTKGTSIAQLFGVSLVPAAVHSTAPAAPRLVRTVIEVPVQRRTSVVEVFHGAKRTEETFDLPPGKK